MHTTSGTSRIKSGTPRIARGAFRILRTTAHCLRETHTPRRGFYGFHPELRKFDLYLSRFILRPAGYKMRFSGCCDNLRTLHLPTSGYKMHFSGCRDNFSTCRDNFPACRDNLPACRDNLCTLHLPASGFLHNIPPRRAANARGCLPFYISRKYFPTCSMQDAGWRLLRRKAVCLL